MAGGVRDGAARWPNPVGGGMHDRAIREFDRQAESLIRELAIDIALVALAAFGVFLIVRA